MVTTDNSLEALLDERQVAEFLNVSLSTIRRRRARRQPPDFCKIGASIRYCRSSVLLLIEGAKQHAEAQ